MDWNIGQEIDGLITASDVKNGRPHPEIIHLAMSKCGLKESSRVAKVGDFVIDIAKGQSAECGYTFGVTTGAQSRKQLESARPTAVVDSLEKVADGLV